MLVLVERLLDDIEAFDFHLSTPVDDVREALEAVVRGGLRTDWSHAGVYRAWREASLLDPGLAKLDERIRTWTAGRIAAALHVFASHPQARTDVDLDALADVLDELFWRVAETPADRQAAVAGVLVHLIVHTVLCDPR